MGKAIKIRVYPTTVQRKILNEWFGTARWTYNQVVAAIRDGVPRNKKQLRAKCVNNVNFQESNEWVKRTPYDICDEVMNDGLKAYGSNYALGRKGFTTGFKKKKLLMIQLPYWQNAGKEAGHFIPHSRDKYL